MKVTPNLNTILWALVALAPAVLLAAVMIPGAQNEAAAYAVKGVLLGTAVGGLWGFVCGLISPRTDRSSAETKGGTPQP